MVASVIERFAPQVDQLLISANRNLELYARFGYQVIADEIGGFAGPLAGLERALAQASHALIATVPCDSPFLPQDLVSRLAESLERAAAQLAVAKTFDQPHPVFCLVKRNLHAHLSNFLASGGRKIDAWYASLKMVEVPFGYEAAAFSNVNTPTELRQLEDDGATNSA